VKQYLLLRVTILRVNVFLLVTILRLNVLLLVTILRLNALSAPEHQPGRYLQLCWVGF